MTTHSSILAWEVPQTEEPGVLRTSLEQQRGLGEDTALRKGCRAPPGRPQGLGMQVGLAEKPKWGRSA